MSNRSAVPLSSSPAMVASMLRTTRSTSSLRMQKSSAVRSVIGIDGSSLATAGQAMAIGSLAKRIRASPTVAFQKPTAV